MNRIVKLTLVFSMCGLFACQSQNSGEKTAPKQDSKIAKADLFSKLFSDSNIKSELFTIDNRRDTTLVSANGVIYRIYSSSFVTSNSSKIEIEIKEALTPVDFVMANLTTISGNELLESGGMLYVNTTSDNKQLKLAKDKEIGVMLPDNSMKEGMSIFEGRKTTDGINWENPQPVLNEEIETLEQTFQTVTYYHRGNENVSAREDEMITDWLWKFGRKPGDKVVIGESEIEVLHFTKSIKSLKAKTDDIFIQEVIVNKGKNGFVEDFNTNYIFSIKKLGWANIDRLFSDPKAEEVDILVSVDNEDEFGYVYTSMILPKYSMYLSGYQKKDDRFGFSHDDSEKMILPIGAKATILVTAYKGDQPYYCLKPIIIGQKMDLSMTLKPIKIKDLKKELEKQL